MLEIKASLCCKGSAPAQVGVLEQLEIEAPIERPCYDANHIEVDGSMHASKPKMICISAFRIAPKVDKSRVEIEVLGLIAHELAHHIGANEKEAVMIQQNAVYQFSDMGTKGGQSYVSKAWRGFDSYRQDLQTFTKNPSMGADQLVYLIEKLHADFTLEEGSGPFYLFSKTDSDEYRLLSGRIMLSLWYVKGQSSDHTATVWKDQYEKFFNGKDSIKHSESPFAENFPNNEFGQEEIKRLTSFHDVLLELYRAERFAFHAYDYIRTFSWEGPLLPLHAPIVKNPWSSFIGKSFKVVATKCSSQGSNPIEIKKAKQFTVTELYSGSEYPTYLKAETDAGVLNYEISSGIGQDDVGIGTVTVSSNQNSVQRYIEVGTGWERKWVKSVHELQKKSSGLVLTHTIFHQDWTKDVPTQSTSSCVYKLTQE